MTSKRPLAPSHLSSAAKRWWKRLMDEFALDDPQAELLLRTALEAWDRAGSAREQIDQEGLTVADARGAIKAHPLLAVEKDSRATMLAALKALRIDVIPTRGTPGRPPGSRGA